MTPAGGAMHRERVVAVLSAAFAVFGLIFYTSFYANLASTISEWSGSGVIWPVQLLHNFLHGRPFQSSLYASPAAGESVGFAFNPHAFIHSFVIHVNFTPYLAAFPWALHPTVGGLYTLLILWNLGGGLLLVWSLLARGQRWADREKAVFCSAVLLASGLLSVVDQMAQFLLFIGPLMMAAHWALRERRRALHLILIAGMCLLSEDAAMVALCWGAYAWLFEQGGRPYGRDAACFAIPYLALVLFVIQPTARAELVLREGTTTALIVKKLFSMTPAILSANVKSMLPVLTLLPAFPVAAALFGAPPKDRWLGIAALAVLPALPHWGECVAVGGGHHLAPPFAATLLALIEAVRAAPGRPARLRPALGWAAVFLALSARAQAGNLPNRLKPALYRLAGKADKAAALERSLSLEEASNRAVIDAARRIPGGRSLVFWMNVRATGHVVNRSDVWEFPELIDRAEFLLIQKDAVDLNFAFAWDGHSDLKASIEELRRRKPNVREFAMDPKTLSAVREMLARTHRTAYEDEHVLVLENLHPSTPESPRTTVGFGWLANVGKKPKKA